MYTRRVTKRPEYILFNQMFNNFFLFILFIDDCATTITTHLKYLKNLNLNKFFFFEKFKIPGHSPYT